METGLGQLNFLTTVALGRPILPEQQTGSKGAKTTGPTIAGPTPPPAATDIRKIGPDSAIAALYTHKNTGGKGEHQIIPQAFKLN